jgi:adenylate kinase family enzyme
MALGGSDNAGPPQRIAVVGACGSGKTTFSSQLACSLGIPHVELDLFHWEPGWVKADDETFHARVAQAVAAPAWVFDGNYRLVHERVWSRADTIVWLDYSIVRIMWQVLKRTAHRTVTRAVLWNGNRIRPTWHISRYFRVFLWAAHTHRKERREFPALFAAPENAHLKIMRFKSPRAAARWVAGLQHTR